jgi:hypothetical protein
VLENINLALLPDSLLRLAAAPGVWMRRLSSSAGARRIIPVSLNLEWLASASGTKPMRLARLIVAVHASRGFQFRRYVGLLSWLVVLNCSLLQVSAAQAASPSAPSPPLAFSSMAPPDIGTPDLVTEPELTAAAIEAEVVRLRTVFALEVSHALAMPPMGITHWIERVKATIAASNFAIDRLTARSSSLPSIAILPWRSFTFSPCGPRASGT